MSTQDSMVPLARISRKQNSKNRLAETSCIGALSVILLKVLVYAGYYDTAPQTGWPKTTGRCCLTAVEARSLQ